jgi:pimeloyl-ACP methyl ester carboxylesterase
MRNSSGFGHRLAITMMAAFVTTILLAACAGDEADDAAATPPTPTATAADDPAPEAEEQTAEAAPTEAPPTPTPAGRPGDPSAPVDAAVTLRELDCGEQLPGYVESRIPDGVTNPRLSCWAMNTLEDYTADPADPASRRIDVTYYVWESAAPVDERAPDPVAYLPGGPRGSAFNSLIPFTSNDIAGNRDLILMDTRGNSPTPGDDLGLPASACPELYDSALEIFAVNEPIETEYAILTAGWQACVDRLRGEGWDLGQYNTPNAVEDLDQLRRALGLDVWNIYGESYSTRYALHYMATYPDAVRSAVIDSATPPDTDIWSPATVGAAVDAVFDQIVAGCAASPECAAAHPDMRGALETAVARLDAAPRQVDVTHPLTGEVVTVSIDGRDFAFGLGELFDASVLPSIPGIVAAIAGGEDALIDASAGRLLGLADGGLGLSGATVCHDFGGEPGRFMGGPDDASATGDPWQHLGYLSNMPCEIIGVTPAPAGFTDPVTSDVPALVVVGMLDSATLPADGLRVAETLGAATLAVFDHESHVPVRTSSCARSVVVAFWDDLGDVDLSCVAEANTRPITYGG